MGKADQENLREYRVGWGEMGGTNLGFWETAHLPLPSLITTLHHTFNQPLALASNQPLEAELLR